MGKSNGRALGGVALIDPTDAIEEDEEKNKKPNDADGEVGMPNEAVERDKNRLHTLHQSSHRSDEMSRVMKSSGDKATTRSQSVRQVRKSMRVWWLCDCCGGWMDRLTVSLLTTLRFAFQLPPAVELLVM